MPIYEYDCQKCSASVEVLLLGQEQPECPSCGSKKLQRKLSVVANSFGHKQSTEPVAGNCGRPQCGMHGCQGLG